MGYVIFNFLFLFHLSLDIFIPFDALLEEEIGKNLGISNHTFVWLFCFGGEKLQISAKI